MDKIINAVIECDCERGIELLVDDCVNLFFFDPPFNIGKQYADTNDGLNPTEYLVWQYRILNECVSKLRNHGVIVYHTIPKYAYKIANHLDELGLKFEQWICWEDGGAIPVCGHLYPKHYPILVFSKNVNKTFNKQFTPVSRCRKCNETIKDYGGKYKSLKEIDGEKVTVLSDVWNDIFRIRHSKNKHRKANELPEKLLNRIIDIYTNTGDVVCDPFSGTRTTLVCAKNKGRNYIGFEISSEYCKIISNRLNDKN